MEKLIKLLNEYGDINRNKAMVEHQDTYIISKKFGFIKWLVENDKIKEEDLQFMGCDDMQIYYKDYERIIMMLSISDTPIEDLILLIK